MVPTLVVFAGLTPGLIAMTSANPSILVTDIFGIAISLFGFLLQAIADYQLLKFRRAVKFDRTEILKSGLFYYIRHPNYCGEVLVWIGLGVIGFGITQDIYILLGAFVMVCLFVFYSGPAMDDRLRKSRGKKFDQYAAKTPSFIPSL